MKRAGYWLIAIAVAILMVWGVRYYFLSRIFYQPDWYEEQKQAGIALKDSEWSQSVSEAETPSESIHPSSTGQQQAAPMATDQQIQPQKNRGSLPSTPFRSKVAAQGAPASLAVQETRLERTLREEGQVRIPAADLVPVLLSEMGGSGDFDPYTIVRGAKSSISPGHMVIEMIVDLEKIPEEQLTPEGVRVLDQVRKLVPEKYLNEVYVKADVLPQVSGDKIRFSKSSTISIGRVSFSFSDIEKRFDIQPEMALDGFAFRQLELQNGFLVLKK